MASSSQSSITIAFKSGVSSFKSMSAVNQLINGMRLPTAEDELLSLLLDDLDLFCSKSNPQDADCAIVKYCSLLDSFVEQLKLSADCNILRTRGGLDLMSNCVANDHELQFSSARLLEQCLTTERVGIGILEHLFKEAGIKKQQGNTDIFRTIGAIEPLKKVASYPNAIASKYAAQALRLIGEEIPHKFSQQASITNSIQRLRILDAIKNMQHGFTVFIDIERLEVGKFDNNLLQSIVRQAKHFLLLLTPQALEREIVAALQSQCNIPLIDNFQWPEPEELIEELDLSSGIPCSMAPKDVTQSSTPANANMRQPPNYQQMHSNESKGNDKDSTGGRDNNQAVPRRPPRQPSLPSTRSRSLEMLDQQDQEKSLPRSSNDHYFVGQDRSLDGLLDEDAKNSEEQNKRQYEKDREYSLMSSEENKIVPASEENQKKSNIEAIASKDELRPNCRIKSKVSNEFKSETEDKRISLNKNDSS
ncbi:Sterile alpha and TIR motif-containing protein 1 [Atta colombica]|uniref:Sterile alpha and TIR motif-containing protein 1 n=1 Tax=Atta colombica TaxID=520822 RepID=A0A195BHW1_9HYME|nr:Sterile alpha and TIR motif-containing protein 1 [Atta colombica]